MPHYPPTGKETHLSPPPLLLVDAHNLLHRAAFGFPARITSRSGADRTLVFGFFALLRAAARQIDPAPEVVVIFDGEDGAAERRLIEPSYKPPATGDPAAFADLPKVIDGLKLLSLAWIERDEWEADDVIASLIHQLPGDRDCLIMSTDRDFYQLVNARTVVLNTARRADQRRVGPAEVHARYGVRPSQWCDFRALTGDQSDNIPGIRGIGPRRAQQLLDGGAGLDDLDRLGRLTGPTGAILRHHWPQLLRWRQLIRLRTDLPVTDTTSPGDPSPLPPAPEVLGMMGLWE